MRRLDELRERMFANGCEIPIVLGDQASGQADLYPSNSMVLITTVHERGMGEQLLELMRRLEGATHLAAVLRLDVLVEQRSQAFARQPAGIDAFRIEQGQWLRRLTARLGVPMLAYSQAENKRVAELAKHRAQAALCRARIDAKAEASMGSGSSGSGSGSGSGRSSASPSHDLDDLASDLMNSYGSMMDWASSSSSTTTTTARNGLSSLYQ